MKAKAIATLLVLQAGLTILNGLIFVASPTVLTGTFFAINVFSYFTSLVIVSSTGSHRS